MGQQLPAGPIEWIALTFPGQALDPGVVPPLREVVDTGRVRVLDAAVIHVDDSGAMTESEVADEGIAAFDGLEGEVLELLNEDDLLAVATGLRPGTTTLVLVWENRWAGEFAESVRRAGGELAVHDRVPRDRVEAAWAASSPAGAPA